METIIELVASLGRHERLTRGHTERVRAYSDMIAVEMGLSEADRYLLQWACLLHDIGKLAVAPEILNKNGKPTDEEWASLRRHPEVGGEIVEPLAPWLGEWRLAASEHHERWDGKGYPRGLAADEISLAGRIVAVADAYDVITSARSYKRPMPVEAARAELVRCAGTQFDPDVVRAFLNVAIGRTSIALGPLGWVREVTALGGLGTTTPGVVANLATAALVSAAAIVPSAMASPVEMAVERPGMTSQPAGARKAVTSTPAETGPGTLTGEGGSRAVAPPSNGAASSSSTGAPGSRTATDAGGVETRPGETTTTSVGIGGAGAVTTTIAGQGGTGGAGGSAGGVVPTTTAVPGGGATTTTAPPATTTPPSTTTVPPPTTTAGRAPVAVDDTGVAVLGIPTSIDVLANDTDADGDLSPSTLSIVSQPGRGSATVANNQIVYQSVGFYLGSTTLVYRVCDSGGRCDNATVTVTTILA
jgi:hypothetical protein